MHTYRLCSAATAALLFCAGIAHAQMGGGMGEMGGGMGGGHGHGGHRGGKGAPGQQGPGQGAPRQIAAPATIPAAMRRNAVITVAGQGKALSKGTITPTKPDQSGVFAERGALLTMDGITITSTLDVSLADDAHETGLGAALIAASQTTATVTGGAIATTGRGIVGIFAADPGTHLTLKGAAISTRAAEAYGVELAAGATLDGDAVTIATTSDHAPAIAIQTGSQATLTGGTLTTGGPSSPALQALGDITANGTVIKTGFSGGLEIDGEHTATLTGVSFDSGDRGILLYQSALPPAQAGQVTAASATTVPYDGPTATATVTLDGGKVVSAREAFLVSNVRGQITLRHVDIASQSGIVLKAVSAKWGPLGRNGGYARIDAHDQTLNGDMVTDILSSIRIDLKDGSRFGGKTTANVDVSLDASSSWTLTGDTRVGQLIDPDGVSGDTVKNIVGNGHVLSYSQRDNPNLDGKTYQLSGGGTLAPAEGL
ncbi:MAG: hypothetical protein JF571_01475 [Asticcacaulis sp.]|nr:hypothetical protein [Asticcacaulis sp.]